MDSSLFCTACGASLAFASPSGDGWRCLTCGASTRGTNGTQPGPGDILVRTYRAKSQEQAAVWMQSDADQLAADGYYPTSQSWAQGQWGCGAFLIALVLAFVLIGILIFIYLLIVKPDGTLTVTYQRRVEAPKPAAAPMKVCPKCAEQVQAAATICRFCRYEFAPSAG